MEGIGGMLGQGYGMAIGDLCFKFRPGNGRRPGHGHIGCWLSYHAEMCVVIVVVFGSFIQAGPRMSPPPAMSLATTIPSLSERVVILPMVTLTDMQATVARQLDELQHGTRPRSWSHPPRPRSRSPPPRSIRSGTMLPPLRRIRTNPVQVAAKAKAFAPGPGTPVLPFA